MHIHKLTITRHEYFHRIALCDNANATFKTFEIQSHSLFVLGGPEFRSRFRDMLYPDFGFLFKATAFLNVTPCNLINK
jgi:hypothetical protein